MRFLDCLELASLRRQRGCTQCGTERASPDSEGCLKKGYYSHHHHTPCLGGLAAGDSPYHQEQRLTRVLEENWKYISQVRESTRGDFQQDLERIYL